MNSIFPDEFSPLIVVQRKLSYCQMWCMEDHAVAC